MTIVKLPITTESEIGMIATSLLGEARLDVGRMLLDRCMASNAECDSCPFYGDGCGIIKLCFYEVK